MITLIRLLPVLVMVLLSERAIAQTFANLGQGMAAPTCYIPALSGWHGGLQANAHYRNQWPRLPATYVTYDLSVDGYAHKIRSGIGLRLNQDRAGGGVINTTSAKLNYSPKIAFKNDLTLMPAVSGSLTDITIDNSKLTFLDTTGALISGTGQMSTKYLSFGLGGAITFKDAFIGIHFHGINNPKPSFSTDAVGPPIPATLAFMLGRTFTFNDLQITPKAKVLRQGLFLASGFGLNAKYRWLYAGVSYDLGGLLGFGLGYEIKERLRLSYSYDYSPTFFVAGKSGSHEIGLRIWLYKDQTKKQFLSNLALM